MFLTHQFQFFSFYMDSNPHLTVWDQVGILSLLFLGTSSTIFLGPVLICIPNLVLHFPFLPSSPVLIKTVYTDSNKGVFLPHSHFNLHFLINDSDYVFCVF